MIRFALILLLAGAAQAQEPLYWSSVAALAAGTAADYTHSLQAERELNPLLRGPDGRMAAGRAAAIKGGALVGTVLLQRVVMRKSPRAARWFAAVNFGVAGGYLAAVSVSWGARP